MRKKFLWLIKLGFVLLCLGIWWGLCIPLAESIIPAFYEQCVYHEFAKNFLREKYGENVYVYNKRLPLSEMNAGKFSDYRYDFRLSGKIYQFLYYARSWSDDGDFYGDNVQSEELYQLVDGVIDVVRYNSTISDFDWISWKFSKEVIQPYHLVLAETEKDDRMFMTKYTGDNLHEFPIRIMLYWDKRTAFDCNRQKLEEIYTSMTEELALYDVDCREIHVFCKETEDYYYITKTLEGIKIEEKGLW